MFSKNTTAKTQNILRISKQTESERGGQRAREREHTTKHNQILGSPNKRCSADDLSASAVNTKQQQQQQQQEESQQQQQQQHAAIESSSWKC